jgi:type II secretory pathway component PulK
VRRRVERNRRGFVTALAITMIALVAVALAGLTARLSTTARQAAREREQAQVEELVLAGIEAARREPGGVARVIELPEALRASGGSLNVSKRGGRVEIEAVVGRTRVVQEVEVSGDGVRVLPG